MLASLTWLRHYVTIEGDPEELAETLTMAGIPVEKVHVPGKDIKNVVTGKILSVDPHPNADKLVVCQVDVGTETLQICTGAKNVRPGQIVPVAQPNSYLPGGIHIKTSKLRGVPSFGMMCSANELGFDLSLLSGARADGIFILPNDIPVGHDIHEFLGLDDVIFEFELTPNRADCFSMVGLAREFAALFNSQLSLPTIQVNESGTAITEDAKVTLAATDLCERFSTRLLRNVKIAPSPEWLQDALRSANIRSINNVVDVTNFVMLEQGQPLHAYDYDTLAGHELICRRALQGELLVTLDDKERTLAEDQLVIADRDGAVGLAGIMGGQRTEVTDQTTTVLLEAATFNGATIRRTARKHGLRSEASGRFERGIDPDITTLALDRAAQLLQEMGACEVAPGYLDVYPEPQPTRTLTVTVEEINRAIGIPLERAEIIDILKRLYFDITEQGEALFLTVPSWRGDVAELADIVEEVARLYGYDKIPNTLPLGRQTSGRQSDEHAAIETIRDILVQAGLSETVTFSFMAPQDLKALGLAESDSRYQAVSVLNPITDDFPQMRTTLVPSLLQAVKRNLAVKNENLALFEAASVYLPKELPLAELPEEKPFVTGVLCGSTGVARWPQAQHAYDFYDVKGLMETVLSRLGVTDYRWDVAEDAIYHPGKAAAALRDGKVLLSCGELHPVAQKGYGLKLTMYIFTVDIEALLPYIATIPEYQSLPKYPTLDRDLAILVPEGVTHSTLVDVMQRQGEAILESVELFDRYSGDQVPSGFVSMAYALHFRAPDRTLQDHEVDERIQRIVQRLKAFNCSLR